MMEVTRGRPPRSPTLSFLLNIVAVLCFIKTDRPTQPNPRQVISVSKTLALEPTASY